VLEQPHAGRQTRDAGRWCGRDVAASGAEPTSDAAAAYADAVSADGDRKAQIEDVHELALAMPHVTVVHGSSDNPVYQVGGKSLQLLREVRDRSGPEPALP
jgi:hypothetical protein